MGDLHQGPAPNILVHSPNGNSEERSQTQIKGSAFGFLEGGGELKYNLHLINRKKIANLELKLSIFFFTI